MKKKMVLQYEPPDGGWGWLVVIGVAVTNMFNQSLISLFGLIFGEELESMGHGTTGAALVMNVMSVVTNFSGLITGPAIKEYSYRKVAIAGGLLTSIGLMLSSRASSVWQLLISYSIISGLGLGLIMPSTFVAVNTYFTARRGRAVGLALAGTGMGQMLMPHVVRYLLDEYGFRGTTLIVGALALHGVVGSALFQPIKWHMKVKECMETDELLAKHRHTDTNRGYSVRPLDSKGICSGTKTEGGQMKEEGATHLEMTSAVDEAPQHSTWSRLSKSLGLYLLKDAVFINITLGLSFAYTASIYFSMLFPFFLQEGAAELTRGQTATCMSVLAGADILGRLSLPTLTHIWGLGARTTFLFGTLLVATSRSVLALQDEYVMLLIVSGITGYVRAGTVVNQNLTISEYVSLDILPCALGLNMVNKGIMVLTIGQFLGWLRDYTGSFQLGIHLSSSLLVLVFIMWAPEMFIRKCMTKTSTKS